MIRIILLFIACATACNAAKSHGKGGLVVDYGYIKLSEFESASKDRFVNASSFFLSTPVNEQVYFVVIARTAELSYLIGEISIRQNYSSKQFWRLPITGLQAHAPRIFLIGTITCVDEEMLNNEAKLVEIGNISVK